jgi:hypothetical protein
MGRVCNGLPGQNVGAKRHGFWMQGHADGYCGRPQRDASNVSRACAQAYADGYASGLAARAALARAEE